MISQKPSNITKIPGLVFCDWDGVLGEVTSEDISSPSSVFGVCSVLQLAMDWEVLNAYEHKEAPTSQIKSSATITKLL